VRRAWEIGSALRAGGFFLGENCEPPLASAQASENCRVEKVNPLVLNELGLILFDTIVE